MAAERAELIAALAKQVGVETLKDSEINAILDLAATAAHGTGDRTSAPLTTFLAGIAAAGGGDRLAAINSLHEHAKRATA